MATAKKLSNPYSTGGGGTHFEAHVQASFVALMLSGGRAPCFPHFPIVEVKLQGKIDGFDTDDLIVVVENTNNQERRKLLGQVKHTIDITQHSPVFGDVMQAAWNDFNNPNAFTKGKDVIALITGPISATDEHNVQFLLNQARHTRKSEEFFRNVHQTKFSPPQSERKLEAFQYHLKAANGGTDLTRDELYNFFNHFYLLGYDLGNEDGVTLSLLHSHISQFQHQQPQWVMSRVVDIVQTWNQDAGTITPDKLPEDLLEAFKERQLVEIPDDLKMVKNKLIADWAQHPDSTYLALAALIGAWQDSSQSDIEVVTQLFGISYDEWLKKARVLLHCSGSPLHLKNGIWKVANRTELLHLLGSRILDQNLDVFKALAVSILSEPDPAFELPVEKRHAASIYGKELSTSHEIRSGVSEGLAILGSHPEVYINCSQGKVEATCLLVIRDLLNDKEWIKWGSLNHLLPTLAEASPSEFLDTLGRTMRLIPCPFDELFSQESNGISGSNYLTGILWALEGLAWDEQYIVRVCVALSELASHDPGGQWANRPINSLVSIFLPWLPQTLASIDKRKVAVCTILREWPDIAWKLILQLLPGQNQTSSGSYKPRWRKTIPDEREIDVTPQEYWQQASYYAELAVTTAGQDPVRLSTLIDHLDNLPEPTFNKLLNVLDSQSITSLPEDRRISIWDQLTKFTNKHRRFSDAKWALPNEQIGRIEQVAEHLAPTNPFNLYQHLFTESDFELYDEIDDLEKQRKRLDTRRENAINEILHQEGIEGIIRFAEIVTSPRQVGLAFGSINDAIIEKTLLPSFLDSENRKLNAMVCGYVWTRYQLNGWDWSEKLDKSGWTNDQISRFLTFLPFAEETWEHASKWLRVHESEYWSHTDVNAYQANGNLAFAVDKLIEYGRPHAAISCLNMMRHTKQIVDSKQCVQALLAAFTSKEPSYTVDGYHIVELIKFLQTDTSTNQDDLFKIEWAYVRLLNGYNGVTPQLLESRLANSPEFFCEIIRLMYRSKKEGQPTRERTDDSKAIATNAWHLLHEWKTPPGTQQDGTFIEAQFIEWIRKVKEVCTESGHLEVALINIGEVLIHTPPEPGGLWINHTVANTLNECDAVDMREGYSLGICNSRGVHSIDPTGKPERDLAKQYWCKAEDVENAGFQRLAATLRNIAKSYEHEADRIVCDYNDQSYD